MNGTGLQRVSYAASIERHLLDGRIVCHYRDDDFTPFASSRYRRRNLRPSLGDLRGFFRRPVVHDEIVTAAENPGRHRLTHASETNEPNLHASSLCAAPKSLRSIEHLKATKTRSTRGSLVFVLFVPSWSRALTIEFVIPSRSRALARVPALPHPFRHRRVRWIRAAGRETHCRSAKEPARGRLPRESDWRLSSSSGWSTRPG